MHGISYCIVLTIKLLFTLTVKLLFSLMAQLNNFQREVIVLFKKEHATLGLRKCQVVILVFFGEITTSLR